MLVRPSAATLFPYTTLCPSRASQAVSGILQASSSPTYLGWTDIRTIAGTLDEVALSRTPLAPSRAQAHFAAAVPPYAAAVLADSPRGYWRPEEPSGTVRGDG